MEKKYTVLYGTRPEAIKLSPVVGKMKDAGMNNIRTVYSGQHGEKIKETLPCDRDLGISSVGRTLASSVGALIVGIGEELRENPPDLLLVQGDTATAYAGAAAGFLCGVKVAHIEAGLRTYDLSDPYPEEFFREEIGKIASLHFAPTERAAKNLLKEGVSGKTVFPVGNTGVDALLSLPESVLRKRADEKHPKILLTVHRRENTGEALDRIFTAVGTLAKKHPEWRIVFPVHPNPIIEERARRLSGFGNVKVTAPLGYADFAALLCECSLVMTDSGGVEEEAATLGIPTVVLRRKTERQEGVESGALRLAVESAEKIACTAEKMIGKGRLPRSYPFGDGKASEKIAKILKEAENG